MTKRYPNVLYHYCSVSAFYNIIKNQSIWLSESRKSNDYLELQWVLDGFQDYVEDQWLAFAKMKISNNTTVDFDVYEKAHRIIESISSSGFKKNWVFCLSEQKDDLGQWRGYADDGAGIAIGFKTNSLMLFEKLIPEEDNSLDFCFRKIKYGRKKLDEFFHHYFDSSDLSPESTTEEFISVVYNWLDLVLDVSAWFKNNGFKSEKEWRLIYKKNTDDLLKGDLPQTPFQRFSEKMFFSDFSYNVKDNNLVSHIDFHIEQLDQFIAEVIIGPKCKLSLHEIELFLVSSGFMKSTKGNKIKIKRSESSYR